MLALDLGTFGGWALCTKYNVLYSGAESFKPKKRHGDSNKYLLFGNWLDDTHDIYGDIDKVFYELVVAHKGTYAAHAYGGFLATLESWCASRGIPCEGIHVGTIKKFITGVGNADKRQVINAVRTLGHDPKNDNEADAIALLYTALSTKTERAVFKKRPPRLIIN